MADGDTVLIDAGLYPGDVCTWKADHLVLRGVGDGYAHLRADGQNAGGKAIWVIQGDYVEVENIEFSLCQVPDQNGAGIRAEGLHLTVRYCSFHHNEMGILTTNADDAEFVIEHSEFAYNGYGDGYSHNVYVGSVKSLIFRYNYSHHGKVGHLLKSRAQFNYILYNRLTDEPGADASREIDLPNGGTAVIMGNIIQQSQESQNGNIIGYGMEGLANTAPHALYVVNNTIVNERFAGRFVMFPAGLNEFKMKNNILAGPGTPVDAPSLPAVLDTSNNLVINDINAVGFADYAQFDYHLTDISPGIDAGEPAGMVDTFLLTPIAEYAHPQAFTKRPTDGPMDMGAYEFLHPVEVYQPAHASQKMRIYPNPATTFCWIETVPSDGPVLLEIFDISGKKLESTKAQLTNGRLKCNLPEAAGNICLIRVTLADGVVLSEVVRR